MKSRRHFLKSATLLTGGTVAAPAILSAQNKGDKVKIAVVGAGGRGGAGMSCAMGEEFVAVADVDLGGRGAKGIAKAKQKFPGIKAYSDYRELFDKHKDLDAVWVATPDHNHFPASIRAIENGAAIYCEKPLTHSVWEARKLTEAAAAKKVATQMGNQGHSSDSIRIACEYIQQGFLGEVEKVHCVSNRSFGGTRKRSESKPVPGALDWESWLGPAPHREFHDGLHPFSWRGWLDFGTGSIGDMGCHTIDGPMWGLKLHEAEKVEVVAEKGGVNEETFNGHARIVFKFPARGKLPPVSLTWWNGGGKDDLPPRPEALEEGRKLVGQGTYYYGAKGLMTTGSHCQGVRLIPETFQKEAGKPEKTIPRVPGHTGDWLRAIKDSSAPPPCGHFGYSGRLTEVVLLGTVALHAGAGTKLDYDFTKGEITNNTEANEFLYRAPRKGWDFGYKA